MSTRFDESISENKHEADYHRDDCGKPEQPQQYKTIFSLRHNQTHERSYLKLRLRRAVVLGNPVVLFRTELSTPIHRFRSNFGAQSLWSPTPAAWLYASAVHRALPSIEVAPDFASSPNRTAEPADVLPFNTTNVPQEHVNL